MKKILGLSFLLFSLSSFSQCPKYFTPIKKRPCNDFTANGTTYCMDLEWVEGPTLNGGHGRGPRNNDWQMNPIESLAMVKLWLKGDPSMEVQEIEGIHIFPWMLMPAMQHGSNPVQMNFDPNHGYFLSKIWFAKMPGCWLMRVATSEQYERMINDMRSHMKESRGEMWRPKYGYHYIQEFVVDFNKKELTH